MTPGNVSHSYVGDSVSAGSCHLRNQRSSPSFSRQCNGDGILAIKRHLLGVLGESATPFEAKRSIEILECARDPSL